MGLLREILRAGREAGPAALNTIRQQIRAGGSNLQQVEQALKTFAVTAQQEGNPLGRRILQRIDPTLQNVIDTERQTRTADALRRMDQQRALRRAAEVGRPAPVPQFGGGSGGRPTARPTASPAPAAPSVSRQERLDLRNPAGSRALVPFTTSRGAVRPAGTSLGGTPYSPGPYNVPPRTEFLTKGGRVETFTPGTGPSVADEIEQALSPKFDFTQQNLYINPFRDPLSLITKGGRVETFTPGTGPSVADEIQQALAETSGSRNLGVQPSARPGQVSFDALRLQEPMGPLSRQLLESDPQTYKSISDLALAAQRQFNVPVTVEDLVGPRGTSILNELQAGSAIVRSPRGSVVLTYAPKVEATLDPEVNVSDVFRRLPGGAEPPYRGSAAAMGNIDPIAFAIRDAVEGMPGPASTATALRNAVGGVRQIDLKGMAIPFGAGASLAAGLGAGAYLASRQGSTPRGQQLTEEQLYPPQDLGPASITPEGIPVEGGNSGLYPPVQGGQDTISTRSFAPPPGQMGAGSVVIRTNDQESNRRQALANAMAGAGVFQPNPEQYSSPREFYRAASAYGRQPGVAQNLQEQFAAQSPRMGQQDMQSWIAANPGLAYQLSLRNAPRDISQQTPNIQEAEIVTPLGSNTANNFVGNTSEAVKVAGGAPADLKEVTDPRLAVSLRPMPRDMQAFFNRPGFSGTSRLY